MFLTKSMFCLVLIQLFYFEPTSGVSDRIIAMLDSVTNLTEGLLKNALNFMQQLTSAERIFEASKQLLAGYPLEAVSTAVNKICSRAITTKQLTSRINPSTKDLKIMFKTACKNHSYAVSNIQTIVDNADFKRNQKVVVFIAGWTSNINNSETVDTMAKAYHCRGDVNFLVVDASPHVNTLFTWAALNTDILGEMLVEALVKLSQFVRIQDIHLIGHSLGAHIAGSAGRNFLYRTNRSLPRITGLDPAKPCFNDADSLTGLSRGDATFVDIIHTNPGVMGIRESIGDVDFYPNGLNALSRGCLDILCAHARSWRYFAETVYPGNEKNFPAKRCDSLQNLRRRNKCTGATQFTGYAAAAQLKGNYFSDVTAKKAPFGQRANARAWKSLAICGLCVRT